LAETAQKEVERGFGTLVVVLEKLLDVLCQKQTLSIHGKVVTPQTTDSSWCEQEG
jgi:hypothetical protein